MKMNNIKTTIKATLILRPTFTRRTYNIRCIPRFLLLFMSLLKTKFRKKSLLLHRSQLNKKSKHISWQTEKDTKKKWLSIIIRSIDSSKDRSQEHKKILDTLLLNLKKSTKSLLRSEVSSSFTVILRYLTIKSSLFKLSKRILRKRMSKVKLLLTY